MREAATQGELSADAEAEARRLLTAAFETAPIRPGLAADLISAAGPDGVASPVTDVVGEVHRRAARQRRALVLVPAGAVALAAAVAGGVTVGVVTSTGAGTAALPDGRAMLTAALAKTSAQSFRFTATTGVPSTEASPGGTSTRPWETITGEFDPASRTGAETIHIQQSPDTAIRFVGKSEYASGMAGIEPTGVHKPWVKFLAAPPSGAQAPLLGLASGFANDQPYDSADLMTLLKSATTVTQEGSVSGNGWAGTKYGFTATDVLPRARPMRGTVSFPISGTVSVDSSGRVRELTSVITNSALHAKTVIDVTFSDFGAPVTVTAPPASQVYDAGDHVTYLWPAGGSI